MIFIKLLLLSPIYIACYQLFNFAVSRQGVERQCICRQLGIIYATMGIICLVLRDLYFAIAGLILIMSGLRLIAYGLDRLNKNVFIDRFDDSQK